MRCSLQAGIGYTHLVLKPAVGVGPGKTHADHNLSTSKWALPKAVRLHLASPSKVALRPSKIMSELTDHGYTLGEKARRAIVKSQSTSRVKEQEKIMPREMRGKFAGVSRFCEQRSRAALEARSTFGPHTAYVVGDPVIDSETQEMIVALSTENLILNAYRQTCYGLPTYVCVDATHRLVVEGHSTLLFGTTGPDQRFHAFAYACCSSENQRAHALVACAIQQEVERLVAVKAASGERV